MTQEELRKSLRTILAMEEVRDVDWPAVEALCLQAGIRLHDIPEAEWPPGIVHRFLDDPDIRRKDSGYGDYQREQLKSWLK